MITSAVSATPSTFSNAINSQKSIGSEKIFTRVTCSYATILKPSLNQSHQAIFNCTKTSSKLTSMCSPSLMTNVALAIPW